MTDVAVPVELPAERARRSSLTDTDALPDLYHAMLADALLSAHKSGGGVFLAVPEEAGDDTVAFAKEIRETVLPGGAEAPLLRVPDVTPMGTLRPLRARSDAASVAVLDPRTPLLARRHLDAAAMRLRRDEIVIGPTPTGGWYLLGTRLDGGVIPPSIDDGIDVLADRVAEDHSIAFLPMLPVIDSDVMRSGLDVLVPAMRRSDRDTAPYTHGWLTSQGIVDTDTS